VAVAFWGKGSQSIFDRWNAKPLHILCNLALGGTNPSVIRKLRTLEGAEVRQLDNLHAKLILTDRAMIVGSANMSSNGLGLEDGEVAGLRELGMVSRDAGHLDAARSWFEDVWKTSRSITDSDLDNAETAWEKRRDRRPWTRLTRDSGSDTALCPPASELEDRKIYFVIYRKGLSEQATARLEDENKKLATNGALNDGILDAYEGWGYNELPKDQEALIIPVYWGAEGAIILYGPQRPYPECGDGPQSSHNGDRMDFMIKIKDPRTLGLPFSLKPSHMNRCREEIRAWLEDITPDAYESAKPPKFCVSVYEFLKWLENRTS
jgi:hypothetical protein